MASPAQGAPAPGRPHDASVVGADLIPDASCALFSMRGLSGGTLLLVLEPAPFEALKASLTAVLGGVPDRFRGASVRLDLSRREVDLFELRRLVHFLKDGFGIHVVGVHCLAAGLQRLAERELKLKVHLDAPAAEPPPPPPAPEPAPEPAAAVFDAPVVIEPPPPRAAPEPEPEVIAAPPEDGELPPGNARLLTIDGTVRSGALVRCNGDVQVFGDVNPGAQIVASGNVVVFGALKGVAHAGCRGDDRAFVLAFDMRPTQVRIGKAISLSLAALPERETRHALPEIAFVSAGDIVIEPYRGRLPGRSSKESA